MEHRMFGKEITNILDHDAPKNRRNYSFLHADRLTHHVNPTKPAVKATSSHSSPALNTTSNPQMVPEYLE